MLQVLQNTVGFLLTLSSLAFVMRSKIIFRIYFLTIGFKFLNHVRNCFPYIKLDLNEFLSTYKEYSSKSNIRFFHNL